MTGLALRSGAMPNRMNRDEFYAAMAPHDDARLRKVLWTLYWRGSAQLRERIEDELRPQERPNAGPKKEPPDPDAVLDALRRQSSRYRREPRSVTALLSILAGPGQGCPQFARQCRTLL